MTAPGWLGRQVLLDLHSAGGMFAIRLTHSLLVTLGCGLLLILSLTRGLSLKTACFSGLACGILVTSFTESIQPQVLGVLFLPCLLLAAEQLPRRHPLLWLPPIFILWANLDASYTSGVLIMVVVGVVQLWLLREAGISWLRSISDERWQRTCLLLLMILVASCIQPQTMRSLVDLFRPAAQRALVESPAWQPLTLFNLRGLLFFTTVLTTVMLLRWSPRRVQLLEATLLVAMAAAALSASHMMPWWAMVWCWALAPHAESVWHRVRRVPRPA